MNTKGSVSLHVTDLFIIESLPAIDRKTGKELYEDCLYWHFLKDNEIRATYKFVSNIDELQSYLFEINHNVIQKGIAPLLHFEFHGNENFFTLKDGIEIPWGRFSEMLIEINKSIKNSLIVVASACYGAHLIGIADIMERSPFFLLIGPRESIMPHVLLTGYTNFYCKLLSSFDISKAISVLKETDKDFLCLTTEKLFFLVFKNYIAQYCQGIGLENRINDLIAKLEINNYKPNKEYVGNLSRHFFAGEQNLKELFNKMAKKYFMLDLYPELSQRFTYEFNDIY